jgi:hypothetical protein
MLPAASVTAVGSTAVTITAPRCRRTAGSPAVRTVGEALTVDGPLVPEGDGSYLPSAV